MPNLPHDVEITDPSTLPKNAHAIQKLTDKLVSGYSHHGVLLMTVTLVVFFIATRLLSDYLFPKIYKDTWKRLTEDKKRGFTNHHVLISAKVLMIGLALYPYLLIVNGLADFSTPYTAGLKSTNGDVVLVATAIFIAMYLHELLFVSSKVSWVSVVHHLGAVNVAAIMVTRNVRWEDEANTSAYTVLIMTYGIFDIMAGLWPRPCMVIRTVWPEKHRLNMCLCYTAMALTLLGSVGETIVAMDLFGIDFSAWSTAVHWATPISHVLFMIAQGCSSWIMFSLGRKHQRQLKQLKAAEKDIESSGASEEALSMDRP